MISKTYGSSVDSGPQEHRYGTARVSKRLTYETAAQQSRALLYQSHVF